MHVALTLAAFFCFVCQHVGCDGVVGSERRWDACGECGGRNTTCRLVSGLFSNHAGLAVGALSTIATLPKGACNVSAVQVAPSASRFGKFLIYFLIPIVFKHDTTKLNLIKAVFYSSIFKFLLHFLKFKKVSKYSKQICCQ